MTYTEPHEHWTAELSELRPHVQVTRKTRAQRKAAEKARLRKLREQYHRDMAEMMRGGLASWEKAGT